MTARREVHLWFWAAVTVLGLAWCGCAGSSEAPPDGSPDTAPIVDTSPPKPDTSPPKLDTMPPDTSPPKLDTMPSDTSPPKLDTMPPDTSPPKPDTMPAGCLVCAGNGLTFPSIDPYSDGLPCAAKAIAYQCTDCPNDTTSKVACCSPSVDCSKFK